MTTTIITATLITKQNNLKTTGCDLMHVEGIVCQLVMIRDGVNLETRPREVLVSTVNSCIFFLGHSRRGNELNLMTGRKKRIGHMIGNLCIKLVL